MFKREPDRSQPSTSKSTLPQSESEATWAEVYPESLQHPSSEQDDETRKAIAYMKRCTGVCICSKCSEDVPIEHQYPIEKFATRQNGRPKASPVPPLLKRAPSAIASVQTQDRARREDNAKVLVHGETIPAQQKLLQDTNLANIVLERLHRNKFVHCKPVQSYGCQAMLRGKHVAIVSAPKSGKSLTYISVLCSMLLEDDNNNLPKNQRSPMILVLVDNTAVAEEVHAKFMVLSNHSHGVWMTSLPLDQKEIARRFAKHRENVDLLIATPDCVKAMLHHEIINLKRLCCVAVENIDKILEKLPATFKLIVELIDKTLSTRSFAQGVQMICSSERWTKKLEVFLASLEDFPVIVIANPMQAALYGRMDMQMQYMKKGLKSKHLINFLRQTDYAHYKCLVLCVKEDISDLEIALSSAGINFLTIHDAIEGIDVVNTQAQWTNETCGAKSVLICTDSVVQSYMAITDVNILIHYTLPATWTQFSSRFTLVLDTHRCPLTATFAEEIKRSLCKTMIFIDETTVECFVRIANFFHENHIEVPQILREHLKQCERKVEAIKVENNIPLCKTLKTFGVCSQTKCSFRHMFSNIDKEADARKCVGLMRGQLMHIEDVNSFYMRVDWVKDKQGNVFETNAAQILPQILKLLRESKIMTCASNICVGQQYVYHSQTEKFRCRVVEIVEYITDYIHEIPSKVRIFGVDNGLTLVTMTDLLFEMDESLADLPPIATECIIAKLLPPFEEPKWTRKAMKLLQDELDCYDKSSTIIEANIILKTKSTVWVDDMFIKESVGACHMYTTTTSLLKDKRIFFEKNAALSKLLALWTEAGFAVPEYQRLPFDKPVIRSEQPAPVWAHIRKDEHNSMYLIASWGTNSIVLRHTKFDAILKQLEQRISKSVKDGNKRLKDSQLCVGQMYAMADAHEDKWSRVLLLKIEGDCVSCLFVDYGDYVDAAKCDLRLLRNQFISCLPFQAIQCTLYGIEHKPASEATIDYICEYGICKGTDFFTPLTAVCLSEEKVTFDCVTKTAYKMLLFQDDVEASLNKLLIENKLADPNMKEPLDVTFLESLELWPKNAENEEIKDDHMQQDNKIEIDGFDFFTLEEGYEPIIVTLMETSSLQSGSEQTQNDAYIPIVAANAESNNFMPQVRWYQSNRQIFIELQFLENKEFVFHVRRNRFAHFESYYENKCYVWDANLFDLVDKTVICESKAHFIEIILTKVKEEDWPRLLKNKEHCTNIKFKLEKLSVPDDDDDGDEEKVQRMAADEIDPEFFKHLEVNKDGEVVEYYSDVDHEDSDYKDSSDEGHGNHLA